MKNVKFRVWDKKREKMCYCGPLEFISSCLPMLDIKPYAVKGQIYSPVGPYDSGEKYDESDKQFVNTNQDDFEIQQFTGLKDADGVDIYEGDIILETWEENNPYSNDFLDSYKSQFVVKYDAPSFVFPNRKSSSQRLIKNYKIKVIGNIFEYKNE